MATTDNALIEVVVEFGVPGPISLGVAGSEGGGGTLRNPELAILGLHMHYRVKHTIDQSWSSVRHGCGLSRVPA